jgi:hypothetical protein
MCLKEWSIIDLSLKAFWYLIAGALLLGFFKVVVNGFWQMLLFAVASPVNFLAGLLVMVVFYLYKKKDIHAAIAKMKNKIKG